MVIVLGIYAKSVVSINNNTAHCHYFNVDTFLLIDFISSIIIGNLPSVSNSFSTSKLLANATILF